MRLRRQDQTPLLIDYNETFCPSRKSETNQSVLTLINHAHLTLRGAGRAALATNRRYLLWNVEKDTQSNIFSQGRAAHEPICVPCKVLYRGSIRRISIFSIWAQWKHGYRINAFSLQPPRCSINCFSRSRLNRRKGIDPKSWMTVCFFYDWEWWVWITRRRGLSFALLCCEKSVPLEANA